MMAFKRGTNYSIYVPLRSGGRVQRSCGTGSAPVMRQIKRVVMQLKDERRWALLEAVTCTPPKLTLVELYDADAMNALDHLEARLSSVLLAEVKADWLTAVATRLGGSEHERSSVQNYSQQLNSFLAMYPAATTADITVSNVTAWLSSRTKTTTGTRRKFFYAMKSLVRYLIERGHLAGDPLAAMRPPKKDQARVRWETEETDRLIVGAANTHYRAVLAWIKATGADVSSAFRLFRRDLDLDRGTTRIPGTKTGARLVHEARIEPWAIPILREYCLLHGFMPGAQLWPAPAAGTVRKRGRSTATGYTATGVSHHHHLVCDRLGIAGYTLKDSRHSVAVRMRKQGYSFEAISAQLGTSVYQVAKVYARFASTVTPVTPETVASAR